MNKTASPKKSAKFSWLIDLGIIALLLLSFHFIMQSCSLKEPDSSQDGQSANAAPDFTVLDSAGNPLKLSDLKGKPVVINFWATWCPPCKAELPDFQKMYDKYGDQVVFLMVNLTDGYNGETVDAVKSFIKANGYDFPVYYDTKSEAVNAYRISSVPQTYFINDKGEVVTYADRMINASILEQGISKILPT